MSNQKPTGINPHPYAKTSPLPVPTREQFHRSYAGCVTKYDFFTNDCLPGLHVNKIASALKLDAQLKREAENRTSRTSE